MEVWGHIKKARTLLNQRFLPFCINNGYAAFYTMTQTVDGTVFIIAELVL